MKRFIVFWEPDHVAVNIDIYGQAESFPLIHEGTFFGDIEGGSVEITAENEAEALAGARGYLQAKGIFLLGRHHRRPDQFRCPVCDELKDDKQGVIRRYLRTDCVVCKVCAKKMPKAKKAGKR